MSDTTQADRLSTTGNGEKIKLSYPVLVDGVTVKNLYLRRPLVRDLKRMQTGTNSFEQSVLLLSELCSVPPTSIEALDMADFSVLSKKIESFLDSGQET